MLAHLHVQLISSPSDERLALYGISKNTEKNTRLRKFT